MRDSIWAIPLEWEYHKSMQYTNKKVEVYNSVQEALEAIPGRTMQEKLNHCNLCNCCSRHTTNRPTSFKPWIELPRSNWGEEENLCECDCRHMARFICRQCPQNFLPLRN